MPVYSKSLGDTVKEARNRLGLTQNEAATFADIDSRTILNIENYRGNPKMEVLYPLIRALKIDPNEIFYPETNISSPALLQLKLLIEDCTENEAAALIMVIESVLSVLRSKNAKLIE